MLERLYSRYDGPFNQESDPQNPGVYNSLYLRTDYSWDTEAKIVNIAGPYDENYTGGYSGAFPAPESGGISTTQVVDTYPVPSDPNAPGYDAAAQGKTRRVFHDGFGGVTFQDSQPSLSIAVTATDETAALGDGTLTVTATNGLAPVQVAIYLNAVQSPQFGTAPVTFRDLAPGSYTVAAQDSTAPTPQVAIAGIQVGPYVPQKNGCTDPEADNYDPAATDDNGSCTYSPRWRSAWQPLAVTVAPPADASPVPAYLEAALRLGFPEGHPRAATRPLGEPVTVRAVVRPSGLATFNLGPYIRPELGAADPNGGYRLDLNSPTATTDDLYLGYELRRPTGELLERGYALNAAVPDQDFAGEPVLNPFPKIPTWAGYPGPGYTHLFGTSAGRYGVVLNDGQPGAWLPCPPNPVPVAWLAPGGGFGHWVFQGKPTLGDSVGEGQQYLEANTGELRQSLRGDTRKTLEARTGLFASKFREGLRTLLRSPQVWYQPGGVDTPWVPVNLKSGDYAAGTLGSNRNEWTIQFTEAAAQAVQGQ